MYSCPWCNMEVTPIYSDDRAVSNLHGGKPDLIRNPAMCPECFGVGGWEDFGY